MIDTFLKVASTVALILWIGSSYFWVWSNSQTTKQCLDLIAGNSKAQVELWEITKAAADRNLEAAQAYSLALERLEKVIESHPELFKDGEEGK